MAERGASDGGGRPLRPPSALTPLDRAWRRRQWRLKSAHDDFALHAFAGDPRGPIQAAAGLVRLHRKLLRDNVRACRKADAVAGVRSDAATAARHRVTVAARSYRSAIAALADAVATFNALNARIAPLCDGAATPDIRRESRESSRTVEPIC